MRDRPVIAVVAGIILLGSLTAIFLTTRGLPLRPDTAIPDEIGRSLARESVKLLGPGARLTVLMRDTATFPQPAADRTLASLTRELRRSGATVSAVQRFEVDPLRPTQVPPGDFVELIRRSAAGDVIVSLLGPPLLSAEQRAALPSAPACRIVVLSAGPFPDIAGLRQLAGQNLLHAAVVDRPAPKGSSGTAARIPESFEELYSVLTFPAPEPAGSTATPR